MATQAGKTLIRSLGKREKLLAQTAYLRNKEQLVEDPGIRKLIIEEKTFATDELRRLESQIKSFGYSVPERGSADIFAEVSRELNEMSTPSDLLNWIMEKMPEEYQGQIEKSYRKHRTLNPRVAGKWVGQFISHDKNFDAGEFCIGICQIGSKVFGHGAFLDSLYTNVFVKGLADEDEIIVEVRSDSVSMVSAFTGQIKEEAGGLHIIGDYQVENGFDKGRIESVIEKGVSKLSSKGEKLLLFAELRTMIASGDPEKLLQVFEKLDEPGYEQEIIMQTKRLNGLNQRNRIGLLSYSEFQLEETKIVYDLLNMISEMESHYRRN